MPTGREPELLGAADRAAGAPSNLAASASVVGQVNLAWTNNATNQTGFTVSRSTDGDNFDPVTTALPASATSFTDSGLDASATYYYQVYATNSVGGSSGSNIINVTTAAGTTTYVSDLAWVSATVGYKTIMKDQSINGNPLTLAGTVYAKGIGTHAVSDIVYALGGKYASFISDVGVDSENQGNGIGSVDFQVIGDGVVMFDSGVVTNASAPVTINLNVTGVQQLTLVANNGVPGSIDYDHADWAGRKGPHQAPPPQSLRCIG